MRKLIEITFMSVDGVIDAPDIIKEAQRYFSGDKQHDEYQGKWLFAADALLLGRATYELFSKAYLAMAQAGQGAPTDLIERMNSIPKFVASRTLGVASWNAEVIRGDIVAEVRKIKERPGKNIVKYGTGVLDHVLFDAGLIDRLCLIVYPFLLGHGTHLFEKVGLTRHLQLSDMQRFQSGTVVLEYTPKQ